jgi:acetylglutamate synthase
MCGSVQTDQLHKNTASILTAQDGVAIIVESAAPLIHQENVRARNNVSAILLGEQHVAQVTLNS